jgi:hypothetical protein
MRSMQKTGALLLYCKEVEMKVKDVILLAATLLGCEEDIRCYIEEEDDEYAQKAEMLLHCLHLVENELALDYFPLVAEQEIHTDSGKVVFSNLSKDVVRIIKVVDENENSIAYQLFPSYLMTQEGDVKVIYSYTPSQKDWDESLDFTLYVSQRLLAYGIAAEYCTAMGRLDEANIWDEKYKDAIEAAYKVQSGGKIPSRRWV